MKDTEDELQFGDMIELDFVGEEDGIKKHSHLEMKFMPEVVNDLLEEDVIEIREVEDEEEKEETVEFTDDDDNLIDDIYEDIESLEKRVDALEDAVKKQNKTLDKICDKLESLIECIHDINTKKNAKTAPKK